MVPSESSVTAGAGVLAQPLVASILLEPGLMLWGASVLLGLKLGSEKVLVLLELRLSPQLWPCIAAALLGPPLRP